VDRRKVGAALGIFVAVLGVLTYQRNLLWASDTVLWEDTLRTSPNKQRVRFQLAHNYYSNGRCADAVAQYAEAARVQKPDYGLLVDWALAYDCLDQPDAAVAKLKQAAALDPTAHVYSQIGMVYAKRSRWPEALASLAQAEKADPKYAPTYYYRGGIRAKNGDFAGAVADYRVALILDPQMEPARQGMAYAEQQLGAHR
jgi:tetratricopeptide (TPR) repeat protein